MEDLPGGRTRGTDLRRLRVRAGLSQVELARRLGIPASVLSAYERGRREPRVDVFFRAVEVAGFHVDYVPKGGSRAEPARRVVPNAEEKAEVLVRVAAIGMMLPRRDRGPLRYPTFASMTRHAGV